MARKKQYGNLEVDEDFEFQQKEWKAERIGWVFMLIIALAALLGLFGMGPLSKTSAASESSIIQADYQRILRNQKTSDLSILLSSQAVQEDEFVLWLNEDYLSHFMIESIIPEPDSIDIEQGRYIYHFKAGEQISSGRVIFLLTPLGAGLPSGQLGLLSGEELPITQIILP